MDECDRCGEDVPEGEGLEVSDSGQESTIYCEDCKWDNRTYKEANSETRVDGVQCKWCGETRRISLTCMKRKHIVSGKIEMLTWYECKDQVSCEQRLKEKVKNVV